MWLIRNCLSLAVLSGLLAWTPTAFAADAGKLPPAVIATLKKDVIPAWQQGNSLGALQKIVPLLASLSDGQRAAVDGLLEEHQVPGTAALIADVQLAMAQQNLAQHLPKPQPREVALIVPEIDKRIGDVVASARDHRGMARPIPEVAKLQDYEPLLYELHVLGQRVEGAMRLALYAKQLTDSVSRTRSPRAKNAPQVTDISSRIGELDQLRQQVEEQQLALRLQRLERSAGVLRERADFKERFIAAGFVDEDGEVLTEFFKTPASAQRRFTLDVLNAPDLAATVQRQVDSGRQAAGELLSKTREFRMGLQWWLRGRYGRGPEGFGLLKSELALASPQAQMMLYMPPETPRPNDSSTTDPVPQYDRRHHYIWMFEYRRVNVSQEQRVTVTGRTEKTTTAWAPVIPVWTNLTMTDWTILKTSLSPSDSRQVMRLVGFLEYGNAISKLHSLVASSPENERAVYDELVKEHPEFTVFSDRSRRLETVPSTLRAPGLGAQGSERRGLCWVTALARLEFAAMLAAFSEVPSPFENVGVTPFDSEAYRELLLDGARTHYWALRNDPALPAILRGSSLNQQTLAYSRRVKLARAMLSAATRAGRYSPEQYQELNAWQESLKTLDGRFDAFIGSAVAATQVWKGQERWQGRGATGYTMPTDGPWVPPGIQFVNWPYDEGFPGLHRDLVQMTGRMK